MAAQQFVTGPAMICVGTGASNALEYLGQTEGPTRITANPAWQGVKVDQFGDQMDYDIQFMGETDNVITLDLVRWDPLVYNKLQYWLANNTFTSAAPLTSGSGPVGGIGTLMGLEGASIRLLIYANYTGKTVFTNMYTGTRNYPRAMMVGPQISPISTHYQTITTVFRASPVPAVNGSYLLWNVDTTGIPSFT